MNARAYAGGSWKDAQRQAEHYWRDTKGGCLSCPWVLWGCCTQLRENRYLSFGALRMPPARDRHQCGSAPWLATERNAPTDGCVQGLRATGLSCTAFLLFKRGQSAGGVRN